MATGSAGTAASGTTAAEATARSALLSVESYTVFLDLTADPDVIRSRTEIQFSCREPGATTFADLTAVAIHEATLNGQPIGAASGPPQQPDARLQTGGQLHTGGRLQLPALAARNTLVVDATIACSRAGRGLTRFTDPADGLEYVLVNCYPTAAPSVFCCFDQFDLRANLTLVVAVPAGWSCIANGAVHQRPAEGEAGIWRFATVPAIRPYEVTLCAGPYVTAPDTQIARGGQGADRDQPRPIRISVRCRPTLAGSPGLSRIATLVGTVLGYYEQLLDVPCPYDKLDIAFTPELGPIAVQFAAVMYVSEELLQRAADPQDQHVALVLAHEVAHLWFGCLVDCRWWDDLWLAEAMASYLSYQAGAAVLGIADAWATFGMSGKSAAYQADSLPGSEPVSSPVDSAADALTRPAAITYSKGAAAIRQLAALIGDAAMRAGLRQYLTTFAWSATTLGNLIGCLSDASGRDLAGWADDWLAHPGVNTLRPELALAPDGTITSVTVIQEPPATGPLRIHQIAVGQYQQDGGRLRRTRLVTVRVEGARTDVPELAGSPMPAALVLNDADLTFAKVRFDPQSFRALSTCAMEFGDPVAEAVCWNTAWDMVQVAELGAVEFADMVARRVAAAQRVTGLAELLERAVIAADFYAAPRHRSQILEHLATATLDATERTQRGSRDQRVLARGFAQSAHSPAQLQLLRGWLDRESLPGGLVADLELRACMLANLAGRGLATDADLACYAADDPVSGDIVLATCSARRPTRAAKEAAWVAALGADQSPRLARAHAIGVWVRGQEPLVSEFRDRYFASALPAIRRHDARTAQRLARALYPATLADTATVAATDAELDRTGLADPIRAILVEQRAILLQVITARGGASTVSQSGSPC